MSTELIAALVFVGGILVGLWLLVDRGRLSIDVRIGDAGGASPAPPTQRLSLGAVPRASPSLALQHRPRLPRPLRDAPTEVATEMPAPARVAVPGRLGDETRELIEGSYDEAPL